MTISQHKRRQETSQERDDGSLAKRVKVERAQEERRARARELEGPEDDIDSEADASSDEGDDLDNDAENLKAYERVKARTGRFEGASATCGVLKSITLINFMCHKHLSVTFGPKLNFLVGHNGSGKSAILTAVAVALGAKASVTGRGQGVKDLIMRGADKAQITLIIANDGDGAFEPTRFSPNIVIERMLDKSGASSYKFRATKDGKILDNKREVLSQICNHFNIDIDSPLTMLTQDAAKSFLATTDESKLYSFFLRGTNLASLAEQYSQTEVNRMKIERALDNARAGIPELEDKEARYARDLETARKAGELKADKSEVEKRLAWAYVRQKEQECEDVRAGLERRKQRVAKFEENISQLQANREPTTRQIQELESEVTEHRTRRTAVFEKAKKAKADEQRASQDQRSNESTIADVKTDIATKQRDIAELNRQMASRGDGPSQQELDLRQRLKHAENILQQMRRRQPVTERIAHDAKQEVEEAEVQLTSIGNRRDAIFRELNREREREAALQSQATDRLAPYGKRIDIVLAAIRQARWKHTPLGPLGQYVELVDQRYKDLIQSAIGGTLCSFAVRDQGDRMQLLRILKDCFQRGYRPGTGQNGLPPIIQHAGEKFDFSGGDLNVLANADTLLSKIRVTDEGGDVVRILINAHKIESTLVLPTSQQGLDEIGRVLSNDRVVAAGIREVTVLSNDRGGAWTQTGRADGYRYVGPMAKWRGNTLFVRNHEQELLAVTAKVQTLGDEHRALVDQVSETTTHVKELRGRLGEKNRELDRIVKGIPKAQQEINKLNDEIDVLQPADGDALMSLKTESEKAISLLEHQLHYLEGQTKNLQDALKHATKKAAEMDEEKESFDAEFSEKMKALNALIQQQAKSTTDERYWNAGKTKADEEVARAVAQLETAENELADWTQKATSFCERVDTDEQVEDLNRRRVALEKHIAEASRRHNIDIDETTARYLEIRDLRSRRKNQIINFEQLSKMMKRTIDQRQSKWQDLRHHIAVRARTAFIANIHKRGYEGRLVFDHDHEQLRILVQTTGLHETQGNSTQSRFKAPVNLSGGERSFSTVSFLLALWDTAPSSIRCLDEWDVFLDMVNRQRAAKMLIDGARESDSKQYLLITPQDMGGVNTAGPDNKVIRLQDPTRNQQTLDDFTQN